MNKTFVLYLSGLLLVLTACSKNEEAPPTAPGTVTINGDTYAVDTIGTQIWTTGNYTGPGGFEHEQKPGYVTFGKYYTPQEAVKIALPDGWRIPTRKDYNKLLSRFTDNATADSNYYGGISTFNALAASNSWAMPGTNSSRFNAYPAGYARYDATASQPLTYLNTEKTALFLTADYWSITTQGKSYTNYYLLTIDPDQKSGRLCAVDFTTFSGNEMPLFSLRLVKDKK